MTRKLKRDAQAFRQRIKMGRPTNWVVVEGRYHDRPFYSRLLESISHDGIAPAQVVLAETIAIDGCSSGGKSHVLKLFDLFDSSASLTQTNSAGSSSMLFFLDRDLDDYSSAITENSHIVYTEHMDVEAEIFAHAKLDRAICVTHGLDQLSVREFVTSIPHPISSLFEIWRPWIQLRLISVACGVSPNLRFSQPSQINSGRYGPVDPKLFSNTRADLISTVDAVEFEALESKAVTHLAKMAEERSERKLVPGKWIPAYLRHLVVSSFSEEIIRTNVSDHEITTACLESINFTEPWVHYYTTRVLKTLARI